jgi:hypothetical protein
VLCALARISLQEAAADPKPEADASPKAEASADAFQFSGGPPHFGFHDAPHGGFGGSLHDPRSLAASHHVSGSEHSHCALLIPGHGKSSHFDHAFGGFNSIQ